MGDYSRLPALAKQLVDQKVRVILAGNERSGFIAAKIPAPIFQLWLLLAIRWKNSSAASRDPAEMRQELAAFRQILSENASTT